jgi:hypothetical protein
MKVILSGLAVSLFVTITLVPANAKGCIKGALIGGAAGHMVGHHGLLGAAAGARSAIMKLGRAKCPGPARLG